jgi:hypothetical protein
MGEIAVKYDREMGSDHVLSQREIFNELIMASVAAQMGSSDGCTSSALLNRESLSEFLWCAFRDLEGRDTLSWCNYEVRKSKGELCIEIKAERDGPAREYVLATDGRKIFFANSCCKNGKVGPLPTNRSCRQLTAR